MHSFLKRWLSLCFPRPISLRGEVAALEKHIGVISHRLFPHSLINALFPSFYYMLAFLCVHRISWSRHFHEWCRRELQRKLRLVNIVLINNIFHRLINCHTSRSMGTSWISFSQPTGPRTPGKISGITITFKANVSVFLRNKCCSPIFYGHAQY